MKEIVVSLLDDKVTQLEPAIYAMSGLEGVSSNVIIICAAADGFLMNNLLAIWITTQ